MFRVVPSFHKFAREDQLLEILDAVIMKQICMAIEYVNWNSECSENQNKLFIRVTRCSLQDPFIWENKYAAELCF